MATELVRTPSVYLNEKSPKTGAAFREMRNAITADGPLDDKMCELIMLAGFAIKGFESAFKVHSIRTLKLGVPEQAIRQTVLLCLGSAMTMFETTKALHWLDEAAAEVRAGA